MRGVEVYMYFRCVLATAAILSVGFADTLMLRNGRTLQGTYLGGTSRQVRMAVGDRVESFDVSEISNLQFEGTGTAPQAQAAAPAQPAAPAQAVQPAAQETSVREQRRVLRTAPAAAAAPAPAAAPAAAASAAAEIPAGTNLTIRMIDDVDSQVANVGQTFRASFDEPVVVGDRTLVPQGADVLTKLVEEKDPSKLTGGGQLTLDIVSITVNGKVLDVTTEGVTTVGQSRTKQTGAVVGGTAALGAIIGAIAGGGKGAAIGAISGAGAGTAIQVLTKGTRVRIPSETRLTFTLQNPVRL